MCRLLNEKKKFHDTMYIVKRTFAVQRSINDEILADFDLEGVPHGLFNVKDAWHSTSKRFI